MLTKAKFVLSKSKVLEKYNELKKMADFVSYSHKTNPEVSKILEKETDSFFSVHTIEDFKVLKDCKRVWFFSQAWNDDELSILFMKGVNKFVVDNEEDLKILLSHIEKSQKKIELLLRMKLKENTVQTGKHFVYGMMSSKVNELLALLKKNKNISKLGIHFHRKTQNVSEWSLLGELEDTIDKENWKNIDYVNIGGGLPAEYKNFSSSVLEGIFAKILELRKWLNSQKIKMIIEPGRYIAAYAVRLEANIKSIYENNIVIDCSVYNAAMDTFVAHIRLLVNGEVEEGEGLAFTIKGCTPDSMDIFRYRVFLKDAKIGDKIVFLNAGAYTYTTDFCNLPKLETIIVE
jgi:ornithine decarboxylase